MRTMIDNYYLRQHGTSLYQINPAVWYINNSYLCTASYNLFIGKDSIGGGT